MPKERNAFRLGLTLVILFILFMGVLYFLAPKRGDMKLRVRFPHDELTTVLKPGAEVTCGGTIVGSVKSIDLRDMPVNLGDETPDAPQLYYAVVTIAVDSSLGLRADCRIVPKGALLGGTGMLAIEDRGVAEPLQPGQMVNGQAVADISSLTRTLADQLDPDEPTSLLAMIRGQLDAADSRSLIGRVLVSLEDLNAITQSLSAEFDPRQKAALLAKLHSIVDHVNGVTRSLRDEMDRSIDLAMLAKLHEALDALNRSLDTVAAMLEENREPIAATVSHIQETTRLLEQEIAARIADQLDVANEASLLAKVHVSISRLGTALMDINQITGAGREVILLNKEHISRLITNIKETSDHLKATSKELRRNPWRLLYQPTLAEAAQANVFDAARAFSEAATHLDDAIIRLQALAETGTVAPDDEQLLDILQQLQLEFEDFSEAEDALWRELKIK